MYKNILVAAEFDEIGIYAIREAIKMAQSSQAQLHAMHIIEPSPSHCYAVFQKNSNDETNMLEEIKNQIQIELTKNKLSINNLMVKRGLLNEEVTHYIESNSIDLLVVGSHGKKGLEHILGSKANKLVQSVPCHVLVVKKPLSD